MISSMSKSVCETPRRKAFFRHMAPILCLWLAVSWPAKAGNAYMIFDMIRPVNNVCSAWMFRPYLATSAVTTSKDAEWFICVSIVFTYTEVERVGVMSIPGNVAWDTRLVSGKGGRILRCLVADRWKTISFVLPVLIVSLFLTDQEHILSYSCLLYTSPSPRD